MRSYRKFYWLNRISVLDVESILLIDLRPEHMKQLYAVCRAKKKIWKEMPNGSHNDTVAEPYYFNHIFDFVNDELNES